MIRKLTGIATALIFTGMVGVQPAAAQTVQECSIYAQQSCLSPNWQNQGYSSNQACRAAYFNHCFYGDPLDPIAFKPDAKKPDAFPATKVSPHA